MKKLISERILRGLMLCLSLVFSIQLVAVEETRPDMFFYLADDQNYWDYGFAGNETVETPHADTLAHEGTLFTRAYTSMAICAPSRSSLYTGLYSSRNGCYMNHIASRKGLKSVAQHLEALGYKVILAGKGHVKPNSVYDWSHYWPTVKVKGQSHGSLPFGKVEKFLQKKTGPVCIFFASEFPHGPYPDVPALEEDEFIAQHYQNNNQSTRKRAAGYYENIRRDDEQLGKLVTLLKSTGHWDESVFFYASDHGIDGKYSTYDRGLRVPLIMRWKGHAKACAEIPALVHFIDVVPTMVEIAGGEPLEGLDGKSILPLIRGETDAIHDAVYGLQTYQNIQKTRIFPGRSITTQNIKLLLNFNTLDNLENNMGENEAVNAFFKMGAEATPWRRFLEVYDLSKDPFERNNLAKNPEYQSIRDGLLIELLVWMKDQGDFIELGKPIPLLKPTLHPLDKTTKFKEVPPELEGSLKSKDYMKSHY